MLVSLLFLLAFDKDLIHPKYRGEIIDSRLHRDSNRLSAEMAMLKSGLSLQHYLLTLGQNGDPADLERIKPFLSHKALQATALFAWGEVEGAPTEPILELLPTLDENYLALAAETLSKLAKPKDHPAIINAWSKWSEKVKDDALFHLWRLGDEGLTKQVVETITNSDSVGRGAVYYMYRSRAKVPAAVLEKVFKNCDGKSQTLIYASRVQTDEMSDGLRARFVALCTHQDWRVRVQGLQRLGGDQQHNNLQWAAFSDSNPNVVRTAVGNLVGQGDPKVDKQLVTLHKNLSPSQLQTVVAAANPEQFPVLAPLTAFWKSSDDIWKRLHWIRFQGNPSANGEAWLLDALEDASPVQQVLAYGALTNRGSRYLKPFIQKSLVEGDPYEMAAALAAYQLYKDDPPVGADYLQELAMKTYKEVDYQYAYIGGLGNLVDEAQKAKILEAFSKHPDYLVRLAALNSMPDADAATRHRYIDPEWNSRVPEPVREVAVQMITDRRQWVWNLETTKGNVKIELETEFAPITCANIHYLSNLSYFDRMPLHRVVPNFVVQGGDNRGDGAGGPGYSIPCEVNPLRYKRGSVGMALSGKDTGGGQFFICHSAQPHLDGGYTIFGKVLEGMDVVDQLEEGDRVIRTRVSIN